MNLDRVAVVFQERLAHGARLVGGFHVETKLTAGLGHAKREVGRRRYYVGIAMLVSISIFNWIVFYVPDLLPAYSERRVSVNLMIDFTFVASFFVLGGGFWDKFRALFIYDAKALIPARRSA